MTILLAPAFGRILPLPLLQPWSWGMAVLVASFILVEALTYGPAGPAIYEWATRGSRGAAVAPLEFQPPPEGPLMTGRS